VEVLLTRLLLHWELLQVPIPDMIWWMPHYILTIVHQVLLVVEEYLHIGIGRLVEVLGLTIIR
jgi:hypothetical protein